MAYSNNSMARIIEEKDFSMTSDYIDVYPEGQDFAVKTGDKFPNQKLKDRANTVKTNIELFKNNLANVFKSQFMLFSDVSPMYGTQVREIITQLPMFSKVVEAFTGMCVGNKVLYDFDDDVAESCDYILNRSNIREIERSIIKDYFVEPISLYRVKNKNGTVKIDKIQCKNFIVYNSFEDVSEIYCYLVFNILKEKGIAEFFEYHLDGSIEKRVFMYADGVIGVEIESKRQVVKNDICPLVLFRNNTNSPNDTYGEDRFSKFESAVIAVCTAYQTILNLDHKIKEMIRKIPDNMLTSDNDVIGTALINKGVASYDNETDPAMRPDIEYIIPELKSNVEGAILVFKEAVKVLAMASDLSEVFWNFEKAGAGVLSGRALEALMATTMVEVRHITGIKYPSLIEMVYKMCLIGGVEKINVDKISIDFNEGILIDQEAEANIINTRLSQGTISNVDAIQKLERIPTRLAKNKYIAILKEQDDLKEVLNNNRKQNVHLTNRNDIEDFEYMASTDDDNNGVNDDASTGLYNGVSIIGGNESFSV